MYTQSSFSDAKSIVEYSLVSLNKLAGKCEKISEILVQFMTSFGFLNRNKVLLHLIESENPMIVSKSHSSFRTSLDYILEHTTDGRLHFLILRLIYSFLTLPSIARIFTFFIPSLILMFKNTDQYAPRIPILTMASSCIIHLFPYLTNYDELFNESLGLFLKAALASTNKLSEMGLRVFGVISSTIKGCDYLDSIEMVPQIAPFLNCEVKNYETLAISCYAQFSSSYPLHSALLTIVPSFLKTLKTASGNELSHSLVFLTNIAPHPIAAKTIAKNIDIFNQTCSFRG